MTPANSKAGSPEYADWFKNKKYDSQKSQHDKFLEATKRAGLNFSV